MWSLGCHPMSDVSKKIWKVCRFQCGKCSETKRNIQLTASFRSAANSGHNMPPAEPPCVGHASTKKVTTTNPIWKAWRFSGFPNIFVPMIWVKHSSSSAWCKVSSYMFAAPGICHLNSSNEMSIGRKACWDYAWLQSICYVKFTYGQRPLTYLCIRYMHMHVRVSQIWNPFKRIS